mmetsp:Transcript_22645/g.49707  ORF Transcript_22645/g.49707 Transcript_22645/m.49707 type:complete len:213 (+) Transcript_22645:1727-2365(+)
MSRTCSEAQPVKMALNPWSLNSPRPTPPTDSWSKFGHDSPMILAMPLLKFGPKRTPFSRPPRASRNPASSPGENFGSKKSLSKEIQDNFEQDFCKVFRSEPWRRWLKSSSASMLAMMGEEKSSQSAARPTLRAPKPIEVSLARWPWLKKRMPLSRTRVSCKHKSCKFGQFRAILMRTSSVMQRTRETFKETREGIDRAAIQLSTWECCRWNP